MLKPPFNQLYNWANFITLLVFLFSFIPSFGLSTVIFSGAVASKVKLPKINPTLLKIREMPAGYTKAPVNSSEYRTAKKIWQLSEKSRIQNYVWEVRYKRAQWLGDVGTVGAGVSTGLGFELYRNNSKLGPYLDKKFSQVVDPAISALEDRLESKVSNSVESKSSVSSKKDT